MPKRLEVAPGTRYGKLIVIDEAESKRKPNGKPERRFNVQCDCGRKTVSYLSGLRSGHATSCGACPFETHGVSKHPLYRIWRAMVDRCHNPSNEKYPVYGGRGIAVCPEWRDDPRAYIEWVERELGLRPTDPLDWTSPMPYWTIDRIDNDRGYEPGNVRWQDPYGQARNKQHLSVSGRLGVYPNGSGYMAKIRDTYLGTFRTKDDAYAAVLEHERQVAA